MEGVGARFGRSSTRYGPTSTVFSGPVRKWKKKWVHVAPPKYNNNNSSTSTKTNTNTNGNNENGPSNLLFYKWAPIANVDNKEEEDDDDNQENDVVVEPPTKRKFRYIPVALLEEQQMEAAENEDEEKVEDETKPNDANSDAVEPRLKTDILDEKPDINDVPMEEDQDADEAPSARQDLNKNLSFNLNSNDDDPGSDTNVHDD